MIGNKGASVVTACLFGMLNFVLGALVGFGDGMDNFGTRNIFNISLVFLLLPTVAGTILAAMRSPQGSFLWALLIVAPLFVGFYGGQLPSKPTLTSYLAIGGVPLMGAMVVAVVARLRCQGGGNLKGSVPEKSSQIN